MSAGREHMRAIASKGGRARAAKLRAARAPLAPYGEPFLAFRDAIGRGGRSRSLWDVVWRVVDGLPLTEAYRLHTGRQEAPTTPCRELWMPAGRRSGKSENVMLRATWRSISRDWTKVLSPGEVGTIPVIASDRDQARNSLRYLKGIVQHPLVKPYVASVKRDSVEFRTGAIVQVHTASWRATRGYTMLDAILEECAFYQAEDSANPDEEILAATRPALLTIPDARIYGISSPYAARGILHAAYADHWARTGDDVLVFVADTASLNPTVSARDIAREFETDAARAASEYGRDGLVSFRQDVEAFLSREALTAVTVPGRFELPPRGDVSYVAFTDPSGGSGDSFTLAIAHHEGARGVLDCVREVRPPFSPDAVCQEFAALLRTYRVSQVRGDHYAGEWPRERFATHGIAYRPEERSKSDLYGALLPLVNAGRLEVLDLPRLRVQLAGLERRTARGGRDSIDHTPGGYDDLANAAAGALVLAAGGGESGLFAWYRAEAQRVAEAAPNADRAGFRQMVRGVRGTPAGSAPSTSTEGASMRVQRRLRGEHSEVTPPVSCPSCGKAGLMRWRGSQWLCAQCAAPWVPTL